MSYRTHFLALLIFCSMTMRGQNPNGDFNPYVSGGIIEPFPLVPSEVDGSGELSFEIGNSGSDALEVYEGHFLTLTITLSYGEPVDADPLSSVGGAMSEYFSWSYENRTYTAKQVMEIPAQYSGSISIGYKVSKNSASPGFNGFNVNICPAPYQTDSNSQSDDAENFYTYTDVKYLAPDTPSGLNLDTVNEDFVTFSWNQPVGEIGADYYKIYRDDVLIDTTKKLTYTDSTIAIRNTYDYTVSAVSGFGYESEQSSAITVRITDMTLPTVPQNLFLNLLSHGIVEMTWEPSTDNIGVVGYNIYRDGTLLATSEEAHYQDESVQTGVEYTYQVSAFDGAGNESELSIAQAINITFRTDYYFSKLRIIPNPSNGVFIVEADHAVGDFTLEIIDATGHVLIQDKIHPVDNSVRKSFDYSSLATGQYYIRLFNDSKVYYEKLMIVK